jgi:hypothetical protein
VPVEEISGEFGNPRSAVEDQPRLLSCYGRFKTINSATWRRELPRPSQPSAGKMALLLVYRIVLLLFKKRWEVQAWHDRVDMGLIGLVLTFQLSTITSFH